MMSALYKKTIKVNCLLTVSDPFFSVGGEHLLDFSTRMLSYVVSLFILIRYIFYPNNGQSKFIFIYFISGLMIFLIASTLDQVKLNMGIAFGLFAIFGIIRYRTPSIELKEMTYLLVIIGMAAINGLVEFNVASWAGLLFANCIVLIATYSFEKYNPKEIIVRESFVFTLSDTQALKKRAILYEEIKNKLDIDVIKAEILKVNNTKKEVTVLITYKILQ